MALPKRFSENILRVFSKKSDSAINELISEAFKDWCTSEGLSPKVGMSSAYSTTSTLAAMDFLSTKLRKNFKFDKMYISHCY